MPFDIGNLITLGIVFIALILFRFLGRSSRSLDNVRKYAAQCKKDISAFVEDKAALIKDLSISLDVERQSAMEMMRRIQNITKNELADKVQALTQIDDRIHNYDVSLEELLQMTGKVQENMSRIRVESAFVEGVGKRITETKDKIDHINKEIGTMNKKLETAEREFERVNAEALEKAVELVVSSAQSVFADLEVNAQTIERKVEEHREAVDKVERGREEKLMRDEERIDKLLSQAIDKAGSRADKIEEAAIAKLRDQAQERLNLIKTNFEEKIKTVQETVKTKLGEIQEQLKANREEWKTETSAVEARQKAYNTDWKKDVQEVRAFAHQQKEEWNGEIRGYSALIKQQGEELTKALKNQRVEWEAMTLHAGQEIINTTQQAIRARLDEIEIQLKGNRDKWEAQIAIMETSQKEYGTEWKQDVQELSDLVLQQKNAWNKEIQEFADLAKQQAGSLGVAIQKQKEDWEAMSRNIGQDIIISTREAIDLKINQIEIQVKENHAQWEAETSAIEAGQNEYSAKWKKDVQELNVFARQQKEAWNKEIQEYADLAKQQTEEINEAIKKQKEDWEVMSRDIGQDIIISTQQTIDSKLNQIEIQVKDNHDKWEAEIAGVKARQKEHSAEWKQDVQELSAFALQQKEAWNKEIQEYADLSKQQTWDLGVAIQKQNEEINEAIRKQKEDWETLSQKIGQDIIASANEVINSKLEKIEIQVKENHAQWEAETSAMGARQKKYNTEWKQDVQELSAFARHERETWNKEIQEYADLSKQQTWDLGVAIQKQNEEINEAIKKQKEDWETFSLKIGQDIIASAHEVINSKLEKIEIQVKENHAQWEAETSAMGARQKNYSAEWKQDVRELDAFARQQKEAWNKEIQVYADLAKQQVDSLNMAILRQNTEIGEAINKQTEEWKTMSHNIGQDVIISAHETIESKLGEIEIQVKDNQDKWEAGISAIEARQKNYSAEWKQDVQELNAFARQQKETWNKEIQEYADLAKQQVWDLGVAIQNQNEEIGEAIKKQEEEWKTTSHNIGQEIIKSVQQTIDTKLDEVEIQIKENHDRWEAETSAIETRQRNYNVEWKQDVQELSNFALQQKETWNKEVQEYAVIAKQQAENLDEALKKQREEWKTISRDTGQEIISAAQERLDSYRLAQEEQFRQLTGIANDATRLEEELRRSMADTTNRVNTDFDNFGQNLRDTWETAYAEFNGKLQVLRDELAGADRDLDVLKEKATQNVSKKLKVFEDEFVASLEKRGDEINVQLVAWQQALDNRLELMEADNETNRQKVEARINEDTRKTIVAQGEKLVLELDRLKADTVAFEEGIREEMIAADESRKSFSEQLVRDLDDLKAAAESELKAKIGQYSLSVSETVRQSQRDLESQIHDFSEESKNQIAGMESTSEDFRISIEEWQARYNVRMRELDDSMEDARRRSREFAAENNERIAATRSSLDEMRKEIAVQAKLFDRTDTLKAELDRHVEDMSSNIDRLLQLKNEITHFENQFIQIKRLEDDVNAKMTRFLSEKRRIEVMENDFNRLLQTSQSVEDKLAQVSNSDDVLQSIQVQLRRLDDTIKDTEEKYQRIERKGKTIQETNDGIDRNFRSLQDDEQLIKRLEETMSTLKIDMGIIERSVESLSEKNEQARDAAEKLHTLDESVQWLEKRIAEMNTAREGLARLATEMKNLDKDAQTQLKLTRSLLDREAGKFNTRAGKFSDEGAPPPRDRDNIIKLKRKGWSVDEIARTMGISKGEVELTLELGPKDT
jgi:hypothetical protein